MGRATKTNNNGRQALGARLRAARKTAGRTLADVAAEAGTDAANISRVERGQQGIDLDRLAAVARYLRIPMSALWADGEPGIAISQAPRRVPLLATDAPLPTARRTQGGKHVITSAQVSGNAFALAIESDAMAPEMQRGDLVICDPDTPASAGHYVVYAPKGHPPIVRQLVQDGGSWYLAPCNPRWPLIPVSGPDAAAAVVHSREKRYL